MRLSDELDHHRILFIDTAPIIYYIEGHQLFGLLAKEVVDTFRSGKAVAYTSVITLVEVLPKPVQAGNHMLAKKFADFLRHGKNIHMTEISADMAEKAGNLRGRYAFLKGMDALQIAVAVDSGAEVFITNDLNLKQIQDIKVIVLKDYL
ncbi:MAG: PIN domain-containing protein [Desulfobacterales bacterium]